MKNNIKMKLKKKLLKTRWKYYIIFIQSGCYGLAQNKQEEKRDIRIYTLNEENYFTENY